MSKGTLFLAGIIILAITAIGSAGFHFAATAAHGLTTILDSARH
jgi:hypothetical protein